MTDSSSSSDFPDPDHKSQKPMNSKINQSKKIKSCLQGQKRFECELCFRKFSSKQNKTKHITLKHADLNEQTKLKPDRLFNICRPLELEIPKLTSLVLQSEDSDFRPFSKIERIYLHGDNWAQILLPSLSNDRKSQKELPRLMKNSRPTSAYQFQKSNSQANLIWKPRPSTAVFPTTSAQNMNISIEHSTDNEHADLPRESLGSRMSYKVTRPQSAFQKPKAAYQVKTQALYKMYESTEEIISKVPAIRLERANLVHKLRTLCNTRSRKLLEDSTKEEKIHKPKESLVNEIKEIWEKAGGNCKEKIRPSTAGQRNVRTVYFPGFEKKNDELPAIPEKKDYEIDLDHLQISEQDMKYFKRPCEIKVVGKELALNIPIFPEFPGKVLKKAKFSKRLRLSETQPVLKNKEFNCNLIN